LYWGFSPDDGAWMARIVARFDDESISAVVREARLSSPLARASSHGFFVAGETAFSSAT
jgi:hypothetical protein